MHCNMYLTKELEMVDIFKKILVGCKQAGELELTRCANQSVCSYICRSRANVGISEDGHSVREYSIEQFTELQIRIMYLKGMGQ